jgi:hypothetical protein
MSCVLENVDKLCFDCSTERYHIGDTSYGYSYDNIDDDGNEVVPTIGLPKCVEFTVTLDIDDKVLYEAIGQWLGEFGDDEISVSHHIKRRIKDEFKEAHRLGKQEHKRKLARFDELVAEIESLNLGSMMTELVHSTSSYYEKPEDWYEDTYLESSYRICCHDQTRFYGWLKDNGFLNAYIELPIKEPVE